MGAGSSLPIHTKTTPLSVRVGIDLRLGARLAAHAGVRSFGQHGHVLAGLVVDPAVVRAGHGAAIVTIALAQPGAAVRAHVLDRRDHAGGAPEEADLLAEERDLRRLARADLAVLDRTQGCRTFRRPSLGMSGRISPLSFGMVPFAAVGVVRVIGRRHGLNTAKHLLELNDHVSTNSHSSGLRPSASMAPASMYQLSISC